MNSLPHTVLSVFVVCSSPAGTPALAETCKIPLSQFIKNSALRHNHTTSAPSTPELHVRRQYSQSFRYTKKSNAFARQPSKGEATRYHSTWFVSTDSPKVSQWLTRSALAQRIIEHEAGCPSGAARLTLWSVLQSTLPCVLTSPALRTAAPSTLPPPMFALRAGTDPLRSQSSAHLLMVSTLEHKRKGSPASPARRRTPVSLRPASATSKPWQRTAPFPLKTWAWTSAACPPLLRQAALSKDSGRR